MNQLSDRFHHCMFNLSANVKTLRTRMKIIRVKNQNHF